MGYQDRRRQRLRRALRPSLPALALLLTVPDAAPAAARESPASGPDFSTVTTRAAASRLARRGELVEIRLFPTELGGAADPENIGYITPQAATNRASIIPSRIRLTA